VLSWALSVTMELPFCIEALEKAFRWGRPEIFMGANYEMPE
jgi:hypothetical protein